MVTRTVENLLRDTRDPDPRVRKHAARELCPCQIKVNLPEVWDRILELCADPDRGVRSMALHTLIDGSPRERADEIVAAFERMRDDPDPRLRRQVRKLLARQRRTGRINLDAH